MDTSNPAEATISEEVRLAVREALREYRADNLVEAERLCREALSLSPGLSQAHNLLGVILRARKQPREAVRSLREAVRLSPDDASAWGNLCNALCDLRRLDRAVEAGKRAVSMEPRNAGYQANLARAYEISEMHEQSLDCYRTAQDLEAQPSRLVDIARLLLKLNRPEEAQVPLREALAAAPENPDAHNNFGTLFENQGDLVQAEPHYRKAISLAPKNTQSHINLGRLLIRAGRLSEARQAFLAAEALDAELADAHFGQAVIHFLRGEFGEALPRYESRRRMGIFRSRKSALPEWTRRDDARGKAVLLCNEQGIGDTIQFARYAPVVRRLGAEAIISCPPELGRLFRLSPELGPLAVGNEPLPHCDLMIPMLSLMRVTGTTVETIPRDIPYLRADPAQAPAWHERIHGGRVSSRASSGEPLAPAASSGGRVASVTSPGGRVAPVTSPGGRVAPVTSPGGRVAPVTSPGGRVAPVTSPGGRVAPRASSLNVGLVWAGRRQHPSDRTRSVRLETLAPLLEIPNVRYFSLQIGEQRAELEQSSLRDRITDLAPHIKDFADTAGAIDQLDLLISVDTAPVHLAGAMGKPVWTLLAFAPDWRWMLNRGDTPWYPTMRLFRQPKPGDWSTVVAAVAEALRTMQGA